jgi:hypothetical protein
MLTTPDFLDALKLKLKLPSDYAVGKHLGVTSMTMSRWRAGGALSDENARRVADLLEMPRAYVLACMAAQRSDDPESSGTWRQIADTFKDKVAVIALLATLGFTGFAANEPVAAAATSSAQEYIL